MRRPTVAALVLFLSFTRAEGRQETPPSVSFEERVLSTLPPDTRIMRLDPSQALLFLDGGRNVVYGVRPAGQNSAPEGEVEVRLGDAELDRFQTLAPYTWSFGFGAFFTGGESSKAFGVRGRKKDGWYLFTSSGSFGPYERVSMPNFSRDGSRFGFTARIGKDWFAVIDGKKQESYSWVSVPSFSQDGKRSGYEAYNGPGVPPEKSPFPEGNERPRTGGEWTVVSDGKPSPAPASNLGFVRFGPEGRAVTAHRTDAGTTVETPGGTKGPFSGLVLPLFTGTGKLVLVAFDKGKWMVMVGEDPPQTFDGVRPVETSPNTDAVVFPANEGGVNKGGLHTAGGRWRIVANGVPGKLFDEVSRPLLSADGKHVAYSAKSEGKSVVVLDAAVFGPVAEEPGTLQLRISASGNAVAWVEPVGEEQKLVLNGGALGPSFKFIRDPVLSADGSSVAFIGIGFGSPTAIMLGAKPLVTCDEVEELHFSPSGKHLAYVGKKDRQLMVGADGKWLFPCSEVLSPLHFSPDEKRLALGIRRDREIVWKVALLE